MIRYLSPYDGKRFLLNLNTKEVHDLLYEKKECQIDEIKKEHIKMFDILEDGLAYPYVYTKNNDGCCHCLNNYHTK